MLTLIFPWQDAQKKKLDLVRPESAAWWPSHSRCCFKKISQLLRKILAAASKHSCSFCQKWCHALPPSCCRTCHPLAFLWIKLQQHLQIELNKQQCVWLLSDGMQNGNDEFHSLHKGRTRFGQNMGVVWLVRSSNPLVSLGTWLGVMHLHHIPSLVQIVTKYVDHTLLKICDILWTILPLNTSCLCLQIWN